MAAGFDRGEPALRLAVLAEREAGSARAQAALGARSDRQVIGAAPDREIVPALLAGDGVVGDLVGLQTGLSEQIPGDLEQGAAHVLIGGDVCPACGTLCRARP